jgi:PAS domain S-box-containing protein
MSDSSWTLGEVRRETQALLDSVKDYAIFLLDTSGRVTTWNDGARAIKQYEASEIIGRDFSVFYTPEDVAAGKPRGLLRTAAAEGRVEDEGWRVRKDGSRLWADVVISAVRNDSGMVVGFLKVTRDLTDRRNAAPARPRCTYRPWAELLRRTFAVDALACPKCQGRMKLLAMVTDTKSIRRFLAKAGEQPLDPPERSANRGPPYWQSTVLRRKAGGDAA